MINVIDTYSKIDSLYENGTFCIEKWENYINEIYEQSAPIFIDDMNDCLMAGNYSYEKDILPIINAVSGHFSLNELHASFNDVTSGLNEKIYRRFGHKRAHYCGKGDVGYYLGTRFVQNLCEKYSFGDVINMSIDDVCQEYHAFVGSKE